MLYYLTFLAIKVKIAFIVGGLIVLVLVIGKFWALVTAAKYMMGELRSGIFLKSKVIFSLII